MAWAPRFGLLLKVLIGLRDRAAAEGLFLEGSLEFEAGNLDNARLMFTYGTRLDPDLAGNFHNLAVVLEKQDSPIPQRISAWERYLAAAGRDPRQSQEAKDRARRQIDKLKSTRS